MWDVTIHTKEKEGKKIRGKGEEAEAETEEEEDPLLGVEGRGEVEAKDRR